MQWNIPNPKLQSKEQKKAPQICNFSSDSTSGKVHIMGSVYYFLNIWQNYSYPDYKVNMIHKWISFLNLGPIPKYAKYNSLKNNYEILLIENLGYHLCGMMTPTSQRPAHLSLTKVFTRCPVLFSEPFLISSLIPPSLPLFYNVPYFILEGLELWSSCPNTPNTGIAGTGHHISLSELLLGSTS